MTASRDVVDGIPVVLVRPEDEVSKGVVMWLSHLGGSAEQTVPVLERFARGGHWAVSFDAIGHGSRGHGDPWEFAQYVLAAFRRRMWPLLGQTTLEAMRVLDWAQERSGRAGDVLAGGISMGGDVAVALAGVDQRVRRVAAVGSTPLWDRPGMRELGDSSVVAEQGRADAYAQWYADQFDPGRNLDRYRGRVEIGFELGDSDRHIPVENAQTFAAELVARGRPATFVQVRTHHGLDHLGVTSSSAVLNTALEWLTLPPSEWPG